jgi:putative hydrolase of the HAD superfamily
LSVVDAVIFDWGGTLTPWKTFDPAEEWRVLARVAAPERVSDAAAALAAAAEDAWARSRNEHRSGTFAEVCAAAEVVAEEAHRRAYRDHVEFATWTDPDAEPILTTLREAGIRVGLLSNTLWPREWHEQWLARDGVLDLFDGAVYTSEIPWTKPHPEAFAAAMDAVGVTDPARCVFVGDRLFDDIYGAQSVGMRTVHIPHSAVPESQLGHTDGEPDAVVQGLAEIPDVIGPWR